MPIRLVSDTIRTTIIDIETLYVDENVKPFYQEDEFTLKYWFIIIGCMVVLRWIDKAYDRYRLIPKYR